MCLALFAYDAHPDFRLVFAANRDELFERPSAPAAFWNDAPEVFAGRDLTKGGTWAGITRGGRFAALTNVRDPSARRSGELSRGILVRDFLLAGSSPTDFARSLDRTRYPSFNLLCGTSEGLFYVRDDVEGAVPVAPGIHGLSNHRLDTPWPKVERGKQRLAALLARKESPRSDELFAILADRAFAADEILPSTGVPLDLERSLSPAFIHLPGYGTRSSTVVLWPKSGGLILEERTFDEGGQLTGTASL